MKYYKYIYFHIDEVTRDSVVASNLKKMFRERGAVLVYGNRKTTFNILPFCMGMFDLLVAPKISHYEYIVPNPTGSDPPVVTLLTESVGALSADFKRSRYTIFGIKYIDGDTRWVDRVAAQMIWGRAMLRMIESIDPEHLKKVHVVGHPRHDRRCVGGSRSINHEGGKIKVGYITRSAAINPFFKESLFERVHRLANTYNYMDPNKGLEDKTYAELVDVKVFCELINKFPFSSHELEIRVHPREDRGEWEALVRASGKPIALSKWDIPFVYWAAGRDHVIGPASTSFYDCMTLGLKPICTNNIYEHRKFHEFSNHDDQHAILEYTHRPKTIEECLSILSKIEKPVTPPPGAQEILFEETDYPNSKNSLEKVVDICMNVMAASNHKSKNKLAGMAVYSILNCLMNVKASFRRMRSGDIEQSATFLLNRSRRKWIDSLAQSKLG